jgi:phosphomannomutase / phosphoglucomutase
MNITPNTAEFEQHPLVHPSGFREYDARWKYPSQINTRGFITLGFHLGQMVLERAPQNPSIVVGHDYRSYSADLKHALVIGLMAAGCRVLDVGLCTTPVVYFGQFHLDAPGMAMVTASHNENGWTGVKMGIGRPLTFGPIEIADLKRRVLDGLDGGIGGFGGAYHYRPDVVPAYIRDLVKDGPVKYPKKIVVSCGNGTPAMFASEIFRTLGCQVIEQNCTLDYIFPNHNPNPEDLKMLHAMGTAVREYGADLALGFDGDGDRCGVVDETGTEIHADILGLLMARDLAQNFGAKAIIADVKSTGLYATDDVLRTAGVKVEYWKTGHAYMKRRVNETGAAAAFEKSGHFFFGTPVGRGYDDGLFSAVQMLRMLDRAGGTQIGHLATALPRTYLSPTMHRECPDHKKYPLADRMTAMIQDMKDQGQKVMGQDIATIYTVNGVRFTLMDGTWGLVRASSNKPEIVVVVESPVSEANMHAMFGFIDTLLTENFPEVGGYDQTIEKKVA